MFHRFGFATSKNLSNSLDSAHPRVASIKQSISWHPSKQQTGTPPRVDHMVLRKRHSRNGTRKLKRNGNILSITWRRFLFSILLKMETNSFEISASQRRRGKVPRPPGYGMADWMKHSNESVVKSHSETGSVSLEMVRQHNTSSDAWIILNGKVYDVTSFLKYHPGGEEEIMKYAARDATSAFNSIHPWVNASAMLSKCFVGLLRNHE